MYRSFDYILKDNPICQGCGKYPSVKLNRFGPVKAFCDKCLSEELKKYSLWKLEIEDRIKRGEDMRL